MIARSSARQSPSSSSTSSSSSLPTSPPAPNQRTCPLSVYPPHQYTTLVDAHAPQPTVKTVMARSSARQTPSSSSRSFSSSLSTSTPASTQYARPLSTHMLHNQLSKTGCGRQPALERACQRTSPIYFLCFGKLKRCLKVGKALVIFVPESPPWSSHVHACAYPR